MQPPSQTREYLVFKYFDCLACFKMFEMRKAPGGSEEGIRGGGGSLGDGPGGPLRSRGAPGGPGKPGEGNGGGRPSQAPGAPGTTWEASRMLPRASFGGWGLEFQILVADPSLESQFWALVPDPGCLVLDPAL